MDKHIREQQQKENFGFTVVSLDESFFFYDSLVRRVWIVQDKRPIVRVTGSHQRSCVFGAIRLGGKQPFRQYGKFNGDTFLDYLKKIHSKFPKYYLFMDKASPHYKSNKVLKYFEENKDTHPGILSNNRIPRVYDDGRDMEYSQTRSTSLSTIHLLQI